MTGIMADSREIREIGIEFESKGSTRKVFLKNNSSEPAFPGSINLRMPEIFVKETETVHVQPETMCGIIGSQPAADGLRSYGCIGFPATGQTSARLIGVLDLRTVTAWVELSRTARGLNPVLVFDLDGTELAPGEKRCLSDVAVFEGESLSALFEQYGQVSGCVMDARIPEEPVFGWCSWYYYYGQETERDILRNAQELRETGILPPGSVIQIDDGWNRQEDDALRNWGDWMPGRKFFRGMKSVADDIHSLEFKAGIWLAPFSVDAASRLAQSHPDWLLNPAEGSLLETGGNPVCGLDLTHPGVLEFIDETFDRVFNEWGFDYVKLDFLHHSMTGGNRYDQSVTRTEALHRALLRIRRIAGDDRFILCCGCPFGPAVGVADAMRIGFDVGSRWHAPMLTELWPNGNCSIKPAAYPSIYCQWMNGRWWLNDPDCLVVRDRPNRFEPLEFNEDHPGGAVSRDAFGLDDEEAGCWARLVYAVGTFYILSEVWNELPQLRKELARQAIQPAPSRFQDVDTDDERVLMMCSEDGKSFAVFNLSDEAAAPPLPSKWIPGLYSEVFSGESLSVEPADRQLPEMLPHSGRVWTRKQIL